MSKFLTCLPVKVEELFENLPKKTFIHSVTYNQTTKAVEIVWENERFETGMVVPIDFPLEFIGGRKLPKGVRDTSKPLPPPVIAEEVKPETKPEEVPPAPVYLTADEFATYKAAGTEMEFQGIEPKWKPVTATDEYVEGFFYRLKPVDTDPKPV